MKYLIAGACLTIIAAGAYFGISEFNAYRERAAYSRGAEAARAEIFKFAHAKEGETEKVRQWCKNAEAIVDAGTNKSDLFEQVVSNCRALGYL